VHICLQSGLNCALIEYFTSQEATNAMVYMGGQSLFDHQMELKINEVERKLSWANHSADVISSIMKSREEAEEKLSPDQHLLLHSTSSLQPSSTLRAHRVPNHINAQHIQQLFSQFTHNMYCIGLFATIDQLLTFVSYCYA
jgi:hypothetical protein